MKKLTLEVYCYGECYEQPNVFFVEVSRNHARTFLSIMEAVNKAREEISASISCMKVHDYAGLYYEGYKDVGGKPLPMGSPVGVECQMCVVYRDYLYYTATIKDTSVRLETEPVSLGMLEQIAERRQLELNLQEAASGNEGKEEEGGSGT
jgi:hypothetical protein